MWNGIDRQRRTDIDVLTSRDVTAPLVLLPGVPGLRTLTPADAQARIIAGMSDQGHGHSMGGQGYQGEALPVTPQGEAVPPDFQPNMMQMDGKGQQVGLTNASTQTGADS